jgi:hypothetical protein
MLLPVLILTAWFVYVEVEMPNRAYECEFDNSCKLQEEEEAA